MKTIPGKLNLPDGVGRAGEAAAKAFVSNELGWPLVESNFRSSEGEIDIVAMDSDELVFIEVKTRTNRSFGLGVEQISKKKASRLQATAYRFLERHDLDDRYAHANWRIDLVTVEMTKTGRVKRIDHITNAVEESML